MNLASTVTRCRRRPHRQWPARLVMILVISFTAAFVLHVVRHIHKAALKAEIRQAMQGLANLGAEP